MQLTVATNFTDDLVDGLRGLPVVELYGKLRQDAVGGGRASYQLAAVSRRRLAAHVARARAAGIGFNYLLNAACLGNREITRAGQREIEALLGWVREIGVESVTVGSPLLLRLVKTRFPQLKVRVSVFAGVDRVRKAQMWAELGADCIVLDSLLVNREFESLRQIRRHVACELELLVNNSCLQGCALSPSHMNALAHASQARQGNGGFLIDWDFLKCTQLKLEEPLNHLRADWIRPEDLHVYEELGYHRFKLVERDLPTAVMLKRVRAYAARRYDGNLLDLVQPYAFHDVPPDHRYYRRGLAWLAWVLRFAFRPGLVNPLRLAPLQRLAELRGMVRPVAGPPLVTVDNRALDGFIERFRQAGCRDTDCGACGWCRRFAEKAVSVDAGARQRALELYRAIFASLDGGDLWRWGRPTAACGGGCAACKGAA